MSIERKIKSILNRVLTFTLAVSMCLTPLTIVNAEVGDTANNGQINSSGAKVGKSSMYINSTM